MIGFYLYCNSCGNEINSRVRLYKCPKCGGELSTEKKSVSETVFKEDVKKVGNEKIMPKEIKVNIKKKKKKRKK